MSRSLELLTDACARIPTTIRKMFGGHGCFAPNGGMFAGIVTDDAIIFKLADTEAREELVAAGGHAWTYDGSQKPMTMREWIVIPDHFYDDEALLRKWAERSHRLVPAKKKPTKPKPKSVKAKPKVAKAKPKKTSR